MNERWHKLKGWEWALIGLVVALLLNLILQRSVVDPDLWGHIRFGQLISGLGGVPEMDPFAYTSGQQPWINHEWMAEVVAAQVYDGLGTPGLLLLRFSLLGATLGLVGWQLTKGPLGPTLGTLATFFVGLGMTVGLGTARPHLFTYFFFALVMVLMVESRGRPRLLWLLPIVFAVWINFHGGVLAGVGVLAVWGVGDLLDVGLANKKLPGFGHVRWWGLLGVGAALALLVNPYGWELVWFLVDTTTEARPMITEWAPTSAHGGEFLLYLLFVMGGGALWVFKRQEISWKKTLVLIVLAILGVKATRHLPLMAIGMGVLLAEHFLPLHERLPRKEGGNKSRWKTNRLLTGVVGSCVVLAGLFIVGSGWQKGQPGCLPVQKTYIHYPQGAVHLVRQADVSGRLVVPFNWGEYTLWHLGPQVQISMDGRRETVYPDSVYQHYRKFSAGKGDWKAWVEPADMALTRPQSGPDNLLDLSGTWVRLYRDRHTHLWGREGSPQAEKIRDTKQRRGLQNPVRPPICFPG